MPPDFAHPRRGVNVEIRAAIQHRGHEAIVFRIIPEMHADKSSFRMAHQYIYHLGEQFLARRELVAVKAPLRVNFQLGIAFVVRGRRAKKRGRIAYMKPDRHPKLAALSPNGVEARVIEAKELSLLVLVPETQCLVTL